MINKLRPHPESIVTNNKDDSGSYNVNNTAIDQDLNQSDQKCAAIKQQILEYPSGN